MDRTGLGAEHSQNLSYVTMCTLLFLTGFISPRSLLGWLVFIIQGLEKKVIPLQSISLPTLDELVLYTFYLTCSPSYELSSLTTREAP